MPKVCAIVPAYNEEKNIGDVLTQIKKRLPKAEVIVVDDGSKDRTAELARKASVIVLQHEKNKGKGEALKTAFDYVKKNPAIENIVIIDADLQFNPAEAERVLEPLKKGEADFVMGSRDFSSVPRRHRIGNFVWRKSFNLLFGKNLKDTNCGFVALNRKALEAIKVAYGGYIIEIAMLAQVMEAGLRVVNVPVWVDYSKKKSSILRGIRMVLGVLIFIWKEGLKYRIGFKSRA